MSWTLMHTDVNLPAACGDILKDRTTDNLWELMGIAKEQGWIEVQMPESADTMDVMGWELLEFHLAWQRDNPESKLEGRL